MARHVLAPLGVEIRKTGCDDYRVNLIGRRESSAYYTDDIDDAIATGKAMANTSN